MCKKKSKEIEKGEYKMSNKINTDLRLKCPHCKKPMQLIDGYFYITHWLCKTCKKEFEFDGYQECITAEAPAAIHLL